MTPDELTDELYGAIGRVAAGSAHLEDAIRYVVASHISGYISHGAVIFEGQSMDWLITNGAAVMDSRLRGGGLGSDGPEALVHVDRLRNLLKTAATLRNDRNLIVHGVWRLHCSFRWDADQAVMCKPRSPNSNRPGQIFHVSRSRYRQLTPYEEAWTVADVLEVATAMVNLADRIRSAQESYENSE